MDSVVLLLFEMALGLAMVAIVASVVYYRHFHPLAGFPGPFLGSVTDLSKLVLIPSIPILGFDLHRKYGPVVRIGPNLLMFNDPRLLPEVYHRKAEKTSWYVSWMFGRGVQAMFLTPSHDQHAARKRIVGPACSMKALKAFENRFDEQVDGFCNALEQRYEKNGNMFDFSEYLRFFLSDTFNHLAYGSPVGCVSKGEDVGSMIQALQDTYSLAASVALVPWLLLPVVRWAGFEKLVMPFTKYGRGMGRHVSFYESQRKAQMDTKQRGFLDNVHAHITADEARAEYITFTAATLDGVAAFISPFMDNLVQRQHRHVLDRIVAEIDEAEKEGKLSQPVARFDEITQLPYFQACISETLRHDAPAQTLLPRITPPHGIYCPDDALYVPGGVEMAASPYIIHRDTDIFGADAADFRPERWLEGNGAAAARMTKYGMWWGYGERKCAGENYAQIEMQKLCFEMLRRFCVSSATPERRFHHEKWAVGMFWNQWLRIERRASFGKAG